MLQAFFSLVRSGLWGCLADATLFKSVSAADWDNLYRIAQTQALLAVTFDGINTLPAELRPPRPLYLQWTAKTVQIEQANERLNRMVEELQTLYSHAGLHPVLLKGQDIGLNYRHPLHRQCGDIDVYLGKQGQHDARVKPRPKGYWAGKWYTFSRATRRCNQLRQFAPGEAFWYPMILIKGTVAIQINRLKKCKDKKYKA